MNDYFDTNHRWDARNLPRPFNDSAVISAWMTGAEIAASAAELTAVYGHRDDIDTALRLARSELRASAMAAAGTEN
ncbi:hypothetical protein [Mycobacteroides chelonae]|uniref:hypothetical protein n=1 Tax=Mycobacteroides chelonae TaxID=1774 RepID=UPI0018B04E44|nr:hypothetical protein [Mycobacteroides chelonae]MBF9519503.1 hypothetical protein [Mycobacteroides chelonae]